MLKKISLAILLSSFSFSSSASSPDAWEAFRVKVKANCEAKIKKHLDINTLDIDPYGSESYGVAIATGTIKGERGIFSQVCIFNKVTEKIELSSVLQRAIDNSIDINKGENAPLDDCLDHAITSLEMNDCQTQHEKPKG